MSLIEFQILTPEKQVASFSCRKVVAYGEEGYLTVLPDHAKMITNIRISELVCEGIDVPEGSEPIGSYFVSGGFMKIEKNTVLVCTPSAERGDLIDTDRAEQALKRATKVSQDASGGIDYDRARASLERAQVRLAIAKKFGRKTHE